MARTFSSRSATAVIIVLQARKQLLRGRDEHVTRSCAGWLPALPDQFRAPWNTHSTTPVYHFFTNPLPCRPIPYQHHHKMIQHSLWHSSDHPKHLCPTLDLRNSGWHSHTANGANACIHICTKDIPNQAYAGVWKLATRLDLATHCSTSRQRALISNRSSTSHHGGTHWCLTVHCQVADGSTQPQQVHYATQAATHGPHQQAGGQAGMRHKHTAACRQGTTRSHTWLAVAHPFRRHQWGVSTPLL